MPFGDFSSDFVFLSFLRFGLTATGSSSSLDMTSALALRLGGAEETVGDDDPAVDDDDAGFLATEKNERMSYKKNIVSSKLKQHLKNITYSHGLV